MKLKWTKPVDCQFPITSYSQPICFNSSHINKIVDYQKSTFSSANILKLLKFQEPKLTLTITLRQPKQLMPLVYRKARISPTSLDNIPHVAGAVNRPPTTN